MGVDRRQLRLTLLRAFAALSSPLRPKAALRLGPAPRILLIRPDHVGDLLFATPSFRLLRQALPEAHLACLVGPWGEPVVRCSPHLDEVIVCGFPGLSRQRKTSLLSPYRYLLEWAQRLRVQRFDLAVVLRFDHWWGALLTYLAGIPHRLGYDIAECRPFLSDALPYVSQRHEVLQNLLLAHGVLQYAGIEQVASSGQSTCAAAGPLLASYQQDPSDPRAVPLEFFVSPDEQAHISTYLSRLGLGEGTGLVAIHPGAGAPVKLWRAEAWAQVADALVERWHVRIVITGGREELDLAWSVYARMAADAAVAAGETTLSQLAALFQRCRLVLGPDCGPLHLAVAVGVPTVHLYGPVDTLKFGPWGDPARHVVLTSDRACMPCNRLDYSSAELADHPCVREIAPETVLAVAERLLQQQA